MLGVEHQGPPRSGRARRSTVGDDRAGPSLCAGSGGAGDEEIADGEARTFGDLEGKSKADLGLSPAKTVEGLTCRAHGVGLRGFALVAEFVHSPVEEWAVEPQG